MNLFIKINFYFCGFLFFLSSCSHVSQTSSDMSKDQFWVDLVKNSEINKVSILEVLKANNLHCYNQIVADSQDQELLSFWGRSLNFDSGAKKQIISDAIIGELQSKFGIKNDNKIVHAGITHTYGYLFSTLLTPYGYKRQRWIAPTLNYGFNFPKNSLSPETIEGGMLSNITYFLGQLALELPKQKAKLATLSNVSSEVKKFNYSLISKTILTEELESHEHLTLKTTLISLPRKKSLEENEYLLIYTVLSPKEHHEEIITAFPIKREAYLKIIAPEELGDMKPVTLRYNAYLDLGTKPLYGARKLIFNEKEM